VPTAGIVTTLRVGDGFATVLPFSGDESGRGLSVGGLPMSFTTVGTAAASSNAVSGPGYRGSVTTVPFRRNGGAGGGIMMTI